MMTSGRAAPAGAGCVQAAQQVLDLPGGLPGAGGGGGPLGIDQGGPRGCAGARARRRTGTSQPGMVLRVLSQRQAS